MPVPGNSGADSPPVGVVFYPVQQTMQQVPTFGPWNVAPQSAFPTTLHRGAIPEQCKYFVPATSARLVLCLSLTWEIFDLLFLTCDTTHRHQTQETSKMDFYLCPVARQLFVTHAKSLQIPLSATPPPLSHTFIFHCLAACTPRFFIFCARVKLNRSRVCTFKSIPSLV